MLFDPTLSIDQETAQRLAERAVKRSKRENKESKFLGSEFNIEISKVGFIKRGRFTGCMAEVYLTGHDWRASLEGVGFAFRNILDSDDPDIGVQISFRRAVSDALAGIL